MRSSSGVLLVDDGSKSLLFVGYIIVSSGWAERRRSCIHDTDTLMATFCDVLNKSRKGKTEAPSRAREVHRAHEECRGSGAPARVNAPPCPR